MFGVLDIALLVLLVVYFICIFKEINGLFTRITNNSASSKSRKRMLKTTFVFCIFNTTFVIILVLGFFLFKYNTSFSFIYNVNNVASRYYKDVDKDELLKEAFASVLNSLDDPYAQIIGDADMNFFHNKNSTLGYGLDVRKDSVYIFDVNQELSKQNVIKNDDKIISVNGVDVSREII